MEFLSHNIAPIMFASLIVFMLLGFPVTFALGACGLFFSVVGMQLGLMDAALLQAIPLRIVGIMSNETLLAIPFFTLMGLILERSGMAEDLLDTIGQLFGPVRGGLAFAVIFVGALLAATTGVVAASVISMGLISLPIMLRYGYDRSLASGVIAASGTLAQIIPPSLVLIVIADQLGRDVGSMYRGAFIPGFVLTGLYVLWIIINAVFFPNKVPALPPEARTIKEANGKSGVPSLLVLVAISTGLALLFAHFYPIWLAQLKGEATVTEVPLDELIVVSVCAGVAVAFVAAVLDNVSKAGLLSNITRRVTFVLIPPLALIFLVLGTIFLGVATPTEGGAMGAVGALVMAVARGRLSFKLLVQSLNVTTKLSCFVMFILVGSTIFNLVFQGLYGGHWVEGLLTNLPGGQIGFLIVVNLLVFFLAFFLDFFELAFIVIPLLGPVAEKLGIDLIWFGVLLGVNMQTSFMHPPFGFALFYLRSVAPTKAYLDRVTRKMIEPVTTTQIYWGAIPFVVIQIIMVALLIIYPDLISGANAKKQVINYDQIQLRASPDSGSQGNWEKPADSWAQPDAAASGAKPDAEPANAGASSSEAAPASDGKSQGDAPAAEGMGKKSDDGWGTPAK